MRVVIMRRIVKEQIDMNVWAGRDLVVRLVMPGVVTVIKVLGVIVVVGLVVVAPVPAFAT